MNKKYRQPRWGSLYLVLPLALGLFWGIQQLHASGVALGLLQVGALVVVGGYVEAWQLSNRMALLHHPFVADESQRVYNTQEVTGRGSGAYESAVEPVVTAGFYSDLFPFPEVIFVDCLRFVNETGDDGADERNGDHLPYSRAQTKVTRDME